MDLPEIYVIDSSALYAVIVAEDRFHNTAIRYYEELKDRNSELWTTSYALSETLGLVHRRFGFGTVSQILEIVESHIHVYWIEETVHSSAIVEFKAAEGRGLSLVDWTIVLVSRIKSARVFTFDAGMANHVVDVIPTR